MSKIRVYQLAKELGMSSREVLDGAAKAGLTIKDYRTTLSEEDAKTLRSALTGGSAKKPAAKKAPAKKAPAKPAAKKAPAKTAAKPAAKKAPAKKAAAKPAAKKAPAKKPAAKAPAAKAPAAKRPAAKKAAAKPAAKKAPAKKAPAKKAAPAERMRVNQLASALGVKNTVVLAAAKDLGIVAKSYQSWLEAADVTRLRKALGADSKPAKKAAPAPAAKKAPAKKAPAKKAAPKKAAAKKAEPQQTQSATQSDSERARALGVDSDPEEVELKPGVVVDLRGSRAKGQPEAEEQSGPRVGPVEGRDKLPIPQPGMVLDLRAKGGAEPAREPRRRSRPERSRDERSERSPEERPERKREERPERKRDERPEGRGDDDRKSRRRDRDEEQNGGRRDKRRPEKAPLDVVGGDIPDLLDTEEPEDAQPQSHVDISIVVMAADAADVLGDLLVSLKSQKLPWETEIMLLDRGDNGDSVGAAAEEHGLRIVKASPRLPSGKAMDQAVHEAHGEILVFVDSHVLPQGNQWLVKLTDPMFEDEAARLGVVDCAVVDAGEKADGGSATTFRRGDKSDEAVALRGEAFAVRKKVARRKRFGSHRGDPKVWMRAVLDSGSERRFEASLVVERLPYDDAMDAAPESAERAQSTQAPEPKAAPASEPAWQPPPEPEPLAEQEPAAMWQVAMRIASRTAEKWVHMATGLERRSIVGAAMAPVDAAREVLASLNK